MFAYIGILTGEIAGMEWLAVDEEVEEYATWANIGLWCLFHLVRPHPHPRAHVLLLLRIVL